MPINFIPRTSTGPPYNVPRWEPPTDAPDFSNFGYLPSAKPTTTQLGLPDIGLGLGSLKLSVATPPPSYEATSESTTAPPELSAGRQGKRTSGGTGLGAYGLGGSLGASAINSYRSKNNKYGINDHMYKALGYLNAAMKNAGLGTFTITDGWRSYASQVSLKRRKPGLAATPGRSVHGIGAAVDIGATSRQKAWLRANAPKYGLYFPFFEKENWHMQLDPRYF